jgi:hypothetical protein
MVHYLAVFLLSCINGDAPRLVLVCGVLDGSRAGDNNLKKLLNRAPEREPSLLPFLRSHL